MFFSTILRLIFGLKQSFSIHFVSCKSESSNISLVVLVNNKFYQVFLQIIFLLSGTGNLLFYIHVNLFFAPQILIDMVVFRTYLYEGVTAFISEFQGFSLV